MKTVLDMRLTIGDWPNHWQLLHFIGAARAYSGRGGVSAKTESPIANRKSDTASIYITAMGMVLAVTSAHALPERTLTLTSPDGTIQKNLKVEVASDAETRRIGLMYRQHMAPDAGMLFIYPARQHIAMWMRNTLIPLDMVFIRGTEVAGIHQNAIPHDETVIPSPDEVDAVLEVNGGYTEKHKITPGWRVNY